MLYPMVTPGPDHANMAPKLFAHLAANQHENMPDKFGRKNGSYYKNYFRADMGYDMKPSVVKKLNAHGFTF